MENHRREGSRLYTRRFHLETNPELPSKLITMKTANEIIEEHKDALRPEIEEFSDVVFPALSSLVDATRVQSESLFRQLAADDVAEKSYQLSAQTALVSVLASLDSVLLEKGLDVNPFTMAAIVSGAFSHYLQQHYQMCDCKDPECEHVPDISDLLFTMAHGVQKNEQAL